MHKNEDSRNDALPVPVPEQRGPVADWNGHAAHNANGHALNDHVRHLKLPTGEPTYVQMLFKQIRKRWRLLAVWMCITAALTALVVTQFAQTMWKAEGALYYSPNFSYATKRLYTPPNMQTVLDLAQSPEFLDRVAKEKDLTSREVKSNLKVAIRKQSDVIAFTFEAPTKEKAEDVSNRALELAIEKYDQLRSRLSETVLIELNADLRRASEEELAALKKYSEWLKEKGVSDLKLESLNVASDIADLQKKIEACEVEKSSLEKRIAETDKSLADPKGSGLGLSRAELVQIQEVKKQLSAKESEVDEAEFELKPRKADRIASRQLFEKGQLLKEKLDLLETEISIREAKITRGKRDIEILKKHLQQLEESPSEAMRVLMQERSKSVIDLKVLPEKIARLRSDVDKRLERRKFLQEIETDGGLEKQQEIEKLKLRLNQLTVQEQEHRKLEAKQTSELTIHTPASAGNAPASSDHLKLAFGTFGLSLMLFVGFVALFDMPRAAKPTSPVPASQLPVPAPWQRASGSPKRELQPLPPRGSDLNNEQLRLLAERIAPTGAQRGKIVLFTPTAKGLRLESLLGDLACMLPAKCGKVLVFEARAESENPPYPVWTRPTVREVADYLTSYLEGGRERTEPCFAETRISTIDYARGDLSRHLLGEPAMRRFRRLINDMKERYSLVLMITPERCQSDDGNVFTPLGEGIVVVVNQDANSDDVEQYLRELRASETPVYGAFTAPAGQSAS